MDYRSQFDLAGEVAVVTGGASGIGLEAASALGTCGARIILLDMNADGLRAAAEALKAAGVASVDGRVLDVTDPQAVEAMATAVVADFGKVDILVNSAGIARLNTALDTPDEEWRLVMDVNVNGVYWASRAFGRSMVSRTKGSIVNLGSMSGLIINRPQTAPSYMVSKGAVHMMTKALAVEWAKSGVRVNALAPGYVGTEMTLKMRERPELFNTWIDMTPMGRLGTPQEIASAILFLASPASSYVTGAILSIDGGYTAW
ncbi:SDR family NAD(P)-dependent oxidoreductase [Mesorhizobium humile]|uniref:SDR family oxidoreductase n=1 Tax=Mesorhizobium humile TaxID=3072313 RepID=A0ABU4YCI2_9HYPH|nr:MULTISPECIES: SDR family oxidoreductase [unclassified Mesorhizobium]MDX8458880.1 SDR family oxidoreductase [Mesorhizobium sp. VK2D]MDX8484662.1 SDR family oxidoreductase [Mesorhizobium sp. VK2B]